MEHGSHRPRGRPDRRRRPVRHRRRLPPAGRSARTRATRSWSPGARSAAPGTSSAIPGSARTPTCSPSATPSGRGRARRPSPTARRSAATSRTPPREYGVRDKIRFHHQVLSADWSTADARWTVTARRTDTGETVAAHLLLAVGLRRLLPLRRGLPAAFAGEERFAGQLVHPQHWPEDLDATGKRIVVIGSGATAVTLVPDLADDAEHVTMLQRTPSYVLSLPGRDPLAEALRSRLPAKVAYPIVRWKNVLLSTALFQFSRRWPAGRAEADPPAHRRSSCRQHRRRPALQPAVRPVGPAAVPGPRRRPVPRPARGDGVDGHRPDRHLHREGHRARVRRAPRRRHRRHRDRAEPAGHGRDDAEPSTASRSTSRRRSPTRA